MKASLLSTLLLELQFPGTEGCTPRLGPHRPRAEQRSWRWSRSSPGHSSSSSLAGLLQARGVEPAGWSQAASRASSQPLLIKPLCAQGGGARPAGASSHLEASTGLGQPARLTVAPPRATRPALGKQPRAHPAAHLSPTRLPFFSDPGRGHHERSSRHRAERAADLEAGPKSESRRLSEDSRGSEWDTRYTRGNPGALTLPSHPGRVSEEVTP